MVVTLRIPCTFRRRARISPASQPNSHAQLSRQTCGMGAPRFSAAQAIEYTHKVTEGGGAVTWDVPVSLDGKMGEVFLEQLTAIGRSLIKAPDQP
jgi:hypothetical protein